MADDGKDNLLELKLPAEPEYVNLPTPLDGGNPDISNPKLVSKSR
mgnify:CR=1 FL=1